MRDPRQVEEVLEAIRVASESIAGHIREAREISARGETVYLPDLSSLIEFDLEVLKQRHRELSLGLPKVKRPRRA